MNKCPSVADILLFLPDKSLALVWEFAPGTTWPTHSGAAFKGQANLTFILAKEVADLAPRTLADTRRLLMAMRKAYEDGQAAFGSDTAPATLDDDERRAIVLALLDHHIETDTGLVVYDDVASDT